MATGLAAPVFAKGVLTSSGVFVDTQTIVIGGKTYTTQAVLTNVDGNVLIGANAEATLANLEAAINLGPGAGTVYAAAMTRNPQAPFAKKISATVLEVYAGAPGAVGNSVTTTETQTNASWGGATMSGGSGISAAQHVEALLAKTEVGSEVIHELKKLTPLAD